ncbi:hypothetical protein GCT13_24090 [Paraburkholderia sp. CNPSo 3157]|uniref:Uncharacterized protein n=1 Tax=Paraburkholderia franconis TaxID=2654983 RepID=A0A7X1NDC2_9BURK|nr:hypothetical protein [Paraburkholderia franconis]MPW19893.1 hypothetical protein [Paraburkholderia franconis]
MHTEQFEYTDDPEPLPEARYDRLRGAPPDNAPTLTKRSVAGIFAFGVAWLFGLEALFSDDEDRSADARRIDGRY